VRFISDYLKANPNTKLDLYYFNNKGINDYNIESVNKNPASWARHDKWVENLKWYEKNNIKPTFDIEQSIKTSQQNDCGCNYRFDKSYIEKAIFLKYMMLIITALFGFFCQTIKCCCILWIIQQHSILNVQTLAAITNMGFYTLVLCLTLTAKE